VNQLYLEKIKYTLGYLLFFAFMINALFNVIIASHFCGSNY